MCDGLQAEDNNTFFRHNIHTDIHAQIRTYIYTYIYTCINIHKYIYTYMHAYMGQVIEKCTIGAGQAKIIKLTITLNNFITLEDQLIPFI